MWSVLCGTRRMFAGLLVISMCAVPGLAGQEDGTPWVSVPSALQARIEAGHATGAWYAAGRRVRATAALPAFYERRGFTPVWTSSAAAARRLDELREEIRRASRHGLDPADYRIAELDSLAAVVAADPAAELPSVDLEILATDAFLTLASHLLMGRVNPETIDPEWLANRRQARFEDVLADALEADAIAATIEAQAPPQPRYARLVAEAEALRDAAAAGGWPTVPDGETLEEGASGPRVRRLRERLAATGELEGGTDSQAFDGPLAEAVKTFQRRHGLDPDGVVGPGTLAALNVGPAERVRDIDVNLERWRWLPNDLGARHIEVNIAGFEVRVVENGGVVRRHRAIVGREYRETPMFSGLMTYLVLAPYWHVPAFLAAADKLPLFKADPGYPAAQRIVVFDRATNEPVDPSTIDWQAMTGAELNRLYRLRQDPGPLNALGAVKFMFPNKYNVYLHDTPDRRLFDRTNRTFSSGCIRVENPLELAAYLLADQPEWTPERIREVVDAEVERTIPLRRPLPVHLLYWTVWVDDDGSIQYRQDVYGRDAVVRAALGADPP